jgi:hypothetical protein
MIPNARDVGQTARSVADEVRVNLKRALARHAVHDRLQRATARGRGAVPEVNGHGPFT